MYGYEWFKDGGLEQLRQESRRCCSLRHFSREQLDGDPPSPEARSYAESLVARVFVVLRDGVQYALRELIDVTDKLVFEVEPPNAKQRRDNFVVSVPLVDIVRVEVQAVHPDDDIDDFGMSGEIGFRAGSGDRRAEEPA